LQFNAARLWVVLQSRADVDAGDELLNQTRSQVDDGDGLRARCYRFPPIGGRLAQLVRALA
jgi:hypothetical protein